MPACEDKVYNNPLFFEEQGFRRQTQDIFRILKSDDVILYILLVLLFRERESKRENAPLLSSLSLSLLSLSLFLKQLLKGGERKREFDRIGDVGTF